MKDKANQIDSENSMPPPNHDGVRKNRSRVNYIGDGLDFGSSRSTERQPFRADVEEGTLPHLDNSTSRDLAKKINEKLSDTLFWSKKLLIEMTTYAKEVAEIQNEYRRIHELELAESDRLDHVAPDVEEAVGTLLNVPQH